MKKTIYRDVLTQLMKIYPDDADFETKVIIGHIGNCTLSESLFKTADDFSDDEIEEIYDAVERRKSGEPLQYIIGEWDFMDSTFIVGEGVLIPRPETEILCEYVIDSVKNLRSPIVYDLCSGSGCIGLSVKKSVPECDVFLVEKSQDALAYLKRNAEIVCADLSVNIISGDIFNPDCFNDIPKADFIVSNPPYIRTDEISDLQKEVGFEPVMALDGGEDGLIFYRHIISVLKNFLKKGGIMAFECGEDQAEDITEIFSENGFDSQVMKDYNNIRRFVAGRKI